MRRIHSNSSGLIVFPPQDPHLRGSLNKDEGVRSAIAHEEGNARRPTAGLCRKGGLLAGEDLVGVLPHALLHPWLEVRIRQIGDTKGRLSADAGEVGNKRMRGIAGDWRHAPWHRLEEWTGAVESDPPDQIG